MKMEDIKSKVVDFVDENEATVIDGIVGVACFASCILGYKLGKIKAYNGTQVTKYVYGEKGNLCEKYVVKFIK